MSQKQKGKSSKPSSTITAIFLVIVSAFICIGIFAVMFATTFPMLESVTATTNGFMNAMQDEDYDKAFSLISSNLKERTSTQGLQEWLQELDSIPVSWTFQAAGVELDGGHVRGTVTLPDNKTVSFSLALVQENNLWKVSHFEWGELNSNDL